MAHRIYRLAEGNGYATRTIDTWAQEEPIISVFWFNEPTRMTRISRSDAAKQINEARQAGLLETRWSEEWYDDSEYPNLSAQLRLAAVYDR